MRPSRRILFTAATLVLGVALASVAGEFALRLFWPQRSAVTVGMFRSDPHAGFSLQPGYRNIVRVPEYSTDLRVDSEGYRVPELAETETADVKILAIGDSFTFGVGVDAEDAWPEVLEDILRRDEDAPVAVRNGGVGGYGPLRSARLLVERQARWDPQVVVHTFYVGNDLEDAKPDTILEVPKIRDGRMLAEDGTWLQRMRFRLRIHSHLYSFVREQFYGLYLKTPLAERSRYLDSVGRAEWPDGIRQDSWPAAQAAVREIADWAEARGVHYLVVVVPMKYQVGAAAWTEYQRRWGGAETAFDRDHAQREVNAFLESEGIHYLDLLPVMRQADPLLAESFYFPVDVHWTPEGHRFAAEWIRRELRELGWTSLAPSPPVAAAEGPRSG
jgi:lysophospholipase L1-like esterase